MKKSIAVLAALLGLATVAAAEVTFSQLERAAGKIAFTSSRPSAKQLCVCQDGGPNHYHMGYLMQSTINLVGPKVHLTMICKIPDFSLDGTLVGTQNCLTFAPLIK
jgi:hypothetical protein